MLELQDGGRIGFDKGGIAKVVEYINSLPDGTEVSTKDIRDFIEKNNVNASPTSIRNIIAGSAPGRERFKDTIKFVDQKGVVKFNEETFKKIDDLLEDPEIKSFRDLGKKLGYKTPKPSGKRGVTVGGGTPLSRNSAIIKAYEASRGKIPADRFKLGAAYARGQRKVEDVLKLQSEGMSTNAIAQKLKMDRRNVRSIFEKFRPEAIKSPTPKADDPTTTIKTRASARRQQRETQAFKKVGEKTANQTKKVIDRIKDKNADILKMSNAEILNDPKIRYSMNIDATGLKIGEPIKFNKYADLSDKEFVKKVKEKAKNKLFYTPEHISEVAKEKLNTAFPNNIVNAPGRMTSQIGLIKSYLRNNPTGEFAAQADEVLKKTGMQFKTGGITFGVKENIVFNSKTNKSNIVENYFTDTKPTRAISGAKNISQLNAKLPIISTMYDVASSIKDDVGKAKYLSAGFKALGLAVAPYVAYTTYQDVMAGKNLVEALERNLIGTDIIGGTKDILAMTPEEKEARAKVKQEQIAELNIDMPTGFGFIEAPPVQTDMALKEAKQKLDAAKQRVAKERAEDEAGVAAIRRQALDKVIDAATGNRTTAMKLAGGGLLKQAGKRSGPPPEKGPGGLASLEDYARTMME